MKKVLFILKRRESYGEPYGDCEDHNRSYGEGLITGLLVSVRLVVEMLQKAGVNAKLEVVQDNNDIDREVHKFKPHIVIIEALWVVPEKFKILTKLHPHVKWIVRLHSAVPFLANEGSAMKWIFEYVKYHNVAVSCNDARLYKELHELFMSKFGWPDCALEDKLYYQPNYYPAHFVDKPFNYDKDIIDIGCFGAIRPMKNQLAQAVAAILFADLLGKKVHFHMSAGRLEMKGAPVLHNLIGLFDHFKDKGHKLILHDWMHHHHFVKLIHKMDINMQVSLSETFNIVSADSVGEGVPLVASKEVFWSAPQFWADPSNTEDMVHKLMFAYDCPDFNVSVNLGLLENFNKFSKGIWLSQV